ncbi:histone H4 transcription factor isoform X2 [Pogonomyrmex barbatus]|uniref:Histone H4 transcription factor isoform X2 n=1 Tax=Pogonomyrmex barbatus TaxID=144034 RepID=A0A6I9W8U1_9HYME|nr:histone H4 transcription factor isoform X2 [Pogonomyrmex barbatus]
MVDSETKLIASKMVLDRCGSWVELQKDFSYLEEETAQCKLDEFEYDDWCNTDSEFDSVSECGGKKRKVGIQLKAEVLDLVCEWKECTFRNSHLDQFLRHISSHIPNVQIGMKDDSEIYMCQWKDCPFDSDVSDEIVRHINYHAYHTKLKCIGSNVRGRIKLPKCHRDPEWRNIIDTPPPHLCRWEECLKLFTNYQMYLYHVTVHMRDCPRGNRVKNGVNCKWTGCNGKYPSLHKLRDHVKCHTKEKVVACPDCGVTFASNTKFHTHCQRQIPLEGCLYTCKGAYTLDRHVERVHGLAVRWYCCHECPIKYRKSYRLTKHLIEAHQLQLPSGHKRFHYTQDEDGCYRLQMVRYEAVDEENVSPVEEADLPDKKYKLVLNQTNLLTEVKIIEDNEETVQNEKVEGQMEVVQDSQEDTVENDTDKSVPVVSNILISIDEIDEKGNIIKQEIVEIQETKELPPSEQPLLILT